MDLYVSSISPRSFDVGASAFCSVQPNKCIRFQSRTHTGRFYSWPRVKSVLLIILLSADMICEVAANELLLCTITVAAVVFCIWCQCVGVAAAAPMTPLELLCFFKSSPTLNIIEAN
jgi:hypothetical protein